MEITLGWPSTQGVAGWTCSSPCASCASCASGASCASCASCASWASCASCASWASCASGGGPGGGEGTRWRAQATSISRQVSPSRSARSTPVTLAPRTGLGQPEVLPVAGASAAAGGADGSARDEAGRNDRGTGPGGAPGGHVRAAVETGDRAGPRDSRRPPARTRRGPRWAEPARAGLGALRARRRRGRARGHRPRRPAGGGLAPAGDTGNPPARPDGAPGQRAVRPCRPPSCNRHSGGSGRRSPGRSDDAGGGDVEQSGTRHREAPGPAHGGRPGASARCESTGDLGPPNRAGAP